MMTQPLHNQLDRIISSVDGKPFLITQGLVLRGYGSHNRIQGGALSSASDSRSNCLASHLVFHMDHPTQYCSCFIG